METLYKVKEVSEILKLHRNTVINMINSDKLRAVMIGNKYYINESELKRVRGGI
jgi:excisionase family DNA binding protein